jgi:hypothetical protein
MAKAATKTASTWPGEIRFGKVDLPGIPGVYHTLEESCELFCCIRKQGRKDSVF